MQKSLLGFSPSLLTRLATFYMGLPEIKYSTHECREPLTILKINNKNNYKYRKFKSCEMKITILKTICDAATEKLKA